MLPTEFHDFEASLTALKVDPDLIAKVTKDLSVLHAAIVKSRFQSMPVDQGVYGGAEIGRSLGYHHSLAHTKASESLTAIQEDLKTFMAGFTAFVKNMNSVDDDAAGATAKYTKAVHDLSATTGFHHSRHVDHQHHVPFGQVPGDDQP